jgi:heme-degrading monooxygenase HmoA
MGGTDRAERATRTTEWVAAVHGWPLSGDCPANDATASALFRAEVVRWRTSHMSEEEAVIIRVFRPTIHPGKESEFESFLRETAVPLVSQQSGLIAQHVGRPRDPSSTEYLYVTVWEDVESIRAFAGERWQEAVIAPDEEHLLEDTWIGHYDTLRLPDAGGDS